MAELTIDDKCTIKPRQTTHAQTNQPPQ